MLADRYRLDTLIASGAVGEVWQGTDLTLDRRVAVKMLRPEHARDEDGLARFRAEAQHAGSLSHPNIAHVYDFCAERPPDPGFLVMELVDGPSLARALDDGPLEPAVVMDIVAQAARGLAAAHRAGLVHRDIKPGNLLIGAEGVIKVTDFGIAQAAGAEPVTRTGTLIGTPAYLAPERGAGRPATPASDLYSLGVVAYQCLSGRIPFRGAPLAVVIAQLEEPMPPLPSSVPPPVAALVAELTRKNPGERPASAGGVAVRAEQLRAALDGLPAPFAASFPGAVPAAPVPAGRFVDGAVPESTALVGPVPDRPPLIRLPARAALVLSAVGAAGLLGWTLLTPGNTPADRHPLSRPAATRHAQPHNGLARHQGHPGAGTPGGMSPAAAVAPDHVTRRAARPARAAASRSASVPTAAAPTPLASPSGTASGSPAPSGSPTAVAPSSSPPAPPTPTPSGSSATGGTEATNGPTAVPTGTGAAPSLAGTGRSLRPGDPGET